MIRANFRATGFIIAVLLGLSSVPAFSQIKLTVAHAAASDFIPLFVGKEKGIFQKHGLEVIPQLSQNIALTPAALMSNQIQIGATTPTNLLAAAEAGLDIVGVLGGSRLQKKNPRIYLVTRPGFTVTSAQDLKGRRVGVPGLNSIIHLFAMKWLLNNKIPPRDVNFVEVPLPQIPDVLKAGQIDAATPIEPIVTRIVSSGAGTRAMDFYHDVDPDVIAAFWIASRGWADANRKALAAYKAAYEESIAYILKNPEEAHKIELQYLKVTAPTFPSFDTGIAAKDLDAVAAIMLELGVLKNKPDTARLIWK